MKSKLLYQDLTHAIIGGIRGLFFVRLVAALPHDAIADPFCNILHLIIWKAR